MKDSLILKMLIAVFICLGLGFLSGYITTGAIEGWYATINKPGFNPPNWIFGPVWSVLYIFIGIVFARSWHNHDTKGLKLMATQFIVNLIWSPVFFGLHQLGLALVIILLLIVLIYLCINHFWKSDKTSAYLLVPYIMWVSFATLLNASILYLN
jgi:tryptophan-rich sensory protein